MTTLYASEISMFPFEEAELANFSKSGWKEAVGNVYADSAKHTQPSIIIVLAGMHSIPVPNCLTQQKLMATLVNLLLKMISCWLL